MSDLRPPYPLSTYLPTLAITLTTGEEQQRRTLIGIRSAVNNVNHPHVVSVPTMRQPIASGEAIIDDLQSGEPLLSILEPSVAHRPLGFAMWAILAAKLSLGDAIEAKDFDCSVEDFAIAQGRSSITDPETGEDKFEYLTMINCLARVRRGAELIPRSNPTFSHMSLESYEALARIAWSKDLTELGPAYSGLETCIHGLCIASAVVLKGAPFAHPWTTGSVAPHERLGVQWLGYGSARAAA